MFFSFWTKSKKNKQTNKVAVFSFWAKPKKTEQVKKEVVVFLKQKGNVFFYFEPLKKRTKKQSFFSGLPNALLLIGHRLSSKKW